MATMDSTEGFVSRYEVSCVGTSDLFYPTGIAMAFCKSVVTINTLGVASVVSVKQNFKFVLAPVVCRFRDN